MEDLELAHQQAEHDLDNYDELAPIVQKVEAEDESEGVTVSEEFVHFNPESVQHTHYDIGPELGLPPMASSVDSSPSRIPNEQYYDLLRKLNIKQKEFYNHVIHWIKTKNEPMVLVWENR